MLTCRHQCAAHGILWSLCAGLLAGLCTALPAPAQTPAPDDAEVVAASPRAQGPAKKANPQPGLAPGSIFGRTGSAREKALREGGGTKDTEAAVARGMKWLARQQLQQGPRAGCFPLEGGHFKDRGQNNDTAGTAFGLLPLLGAGHTHKAGEKPREHPYAKNVENGLAFLLRKQDRQTGDLRGGMYAHCLATIALCEAYGLTQDPKLRRPAQLAVNYLIKAQHGAGGWRYAPGQEGDTSVTGWVVMALKTAQMAKLDVPAATLKKTVGFLESHCDPTDEGYFYFSSASVTPTMSAVGLLCREYLQGWNAQNARLAKGVAKNLLARPPDATYKNVYYYYYATQVLHHHGGEQWKRWNEKMRKLLVDTQVTGANQDAALVGSWSSTGEPYGGAGGRLMSTSLSLLILEVYYRHVPLHRREDK